eukprot:10174399-Ditylum_brightwellii.AAC.1
MERMDPHLSTDNSPSSEEITQSNKKHPTGNTTEENLCPESTHNVNGIQLSSTSNELVEELTVLKELGFSQLNLIKTNINWSQGNTYDLVKCSLRKVWSKNKLITSNYREHTESLYQPGGTATVVLDRW